MRSNRIVDQKSLLSKTLRRTYHRNACRLLGSGFRGGVVCSTAGMRNANGPGATQGDADLEDNFASIARELFGARTVPETLQHIVDLATQTIEGCDAAGIFVFDAGVARTAAASSTLVLQLDRLQIENDEGPCLDASITNTTVYATDLADDGRWPAFAPLAAAAGVRSVLAHSLSSVRRSALNLYGELPFAFGATDRAQGHLFATLARLSFDSAEEREADELKAANLVEALRTREIIGQAQGILMERERITAEQSFDVLRRASQKMNIKLRVVAETVVHTGQNPEDTGV